MSFDCVIDSKVVTHPGKRCQTWSVLFLRRRTKCYSHQDSRPKYNRAELRTEYRVRYVGNISMADLPYSQLLNCF